MVVGYKLMEAVDYILITFLVANGVDEVNDEVSAYAAMVEVEIIIMEHLITKLKLEYSHLVTMHIDFTSCAFSYFLFSDFISQYINPL